MGRSCFLLGFGWVSVGRLGVGALQDEAAAAHAHLRARGTPLGAASNAASAGRALGAGAYRVGDIFKAVASWGASRAEGLGRGALIVGCSRRSPL